MQSDQHKASVSEFLLLRPVHTYLYVFLDAHVFDLGFLCTLRKCWNSSPRYSLADLSCAKPCYRNITKCASSSATVRVRFMMLQSHPTRWQAMPWTRSSLWRSCNFLFSLPPFVGQIEASVDPATCTIRLSLIELRIFSASKNRSVPYEDKWKGVQAVNLLRCTFLPSGFLQLLDHRWFEILAGTAWL